MKKLFIIFLILSSLISFYKINDNNYKIIRKIKINTIKHPEGIPKVEVAKITSFGFENLKADIYWLETIQYIGADVLKASYKKYLYRIINLITELNPYFLHPYKIGLLLLPDYNERYENLTLEKQKTHKNEAIKIGLKGINNLCDTKKVNNIIKEKDLNKIWELNKYTNPCHNYIIPYYLAFDYYFYINNPLKSAEYYKVASANKDSPQGAKILAAIMQGKGGNREKAFFMFINMAKTSSKKDSVCKTFSKKMENIGISIFYKKVNLNGKVLKDISILKNKLIGVYNEKKDLKDDADCENFLNKSIRELNLYYIEKANNKYKKDHNGTSAQTIQELHNKGYINYIPIDYQQTKDYGIIYEYNPKTGNFDYKMSSK